jgi:malate permease and related proteins
MMSDIFISGFVSMLSALGRIFIVIIGAGMLVRFKIISEKDVQSLSKVTVLVLLPALIFSKTVTTFEPAAMPFWWLLPLLAASMIFLGLLLSAFVFMIKFREKSDLAAVASMQNAGYLVLPVGQILYPLQFDEFAIITFLFILGYNPVLWTLGRYLITASGSKMKLTYHSFLSPPAIASLGSVLLVLAGLSDDVPRILVASVALIGEAAVPTATFVLGATLGAVSFSEFPKFWDNLRVVLIKYVLLPGVVILLLLQFNIAESRPLLADFLVIQASAAPAVAMILQARTYGGDTQKIAGTMIVTYLICLLAMPFWIAFWHFIQTV